MEKTILCAACFERVIESTLDKYGMCISCAAMDDNYDAVGNVLPEVTFSDKENEIITEDKERHPAIRHPKLFKEVLKRYAGYQARHRIVDYIKRVNGREISPFLLSRFLNSDKYKPIIENIRLRSEVALGEIPITSMNYRMRKMNELLEDADQLDGPERILAKTKLLSEAHKMTHGSRITVNKNETKTLKVVLEKISNRNKALPERLGRDISAFVRTSEREPARV